MPNHDSFHAPGLNNNPSLSNKNVSASDCPEPKALPTELPFHILFTTRTDIRVLYNIRVKENDPHPISYDSVTCLRGLRQKISRQLLQLQFMERLNMVLQIPELGAIAIATQVGRVMLLTMTQAKERRCGCRIDWILPLKSQQAKNLKPPVPLLGLALSPIQSQETMVTGMEMETHTYDPYDPFVDPWDGGKLRVPPETSRRYRLFLVYYDHTVLSYEISRSPAAKGMGLQDRILLF